MSRQYTIGSPIERLMSRVELVPCEAMGTDCWVTNYSQRRGGYAQMAANGKIESCHRVAYEAMVGPIPDGLQLDHLCRVRACCNPAHLEPVTNRENSLRGESLFVRVFLTDVCLSGRHSMVDAYVKPNGARWCRHCARESRRRCYANRKPLPDIRVRGWDDEGDSE